VVAGGGGWLRLTAWPTRYEQDPPQAGVRKLTGYVRDDDEHEDSRSPRSAAQPGPERRRSSTMMPSKPESRAVSVSLIKSDYVMTGDALRSR
jgi:hypothetical protein